jgi:hypothetical protein
MHRRELSDVSIWSIHEAKPHSPLNAVYTLYVSSDEASHAPFNARALRQVARLVVWSLPRQSHASSLHVIASAHCLLAIGFEDTAR